MGKRQEKLKRIVEQFASLKSQPKPDHSVLLASSMAPYIIKYITIWVGD